jgi:hypothetical protein
MNHSIAHFVTALALFAAAFLFIDAVHILEAQFGAFCLPALCSAALAILCMGFGGYSIIQVVR